MKKLTFIDSVGVLLPKLLDQLPEETWPLIFIHFEGYLNSGCLIEHIGKEKWIELTAKTLTQTMANPIFSRKGKYNEPEVPIVMKHLCELSIKFDTLGEMIQRLIEMSPPAEFVTIMNEFFDANIGYHQPDKVKDMFLQLIATALEKAHVEKDTFITDCIKIPTHIVHKDPPLALRHDLRILFWKEPFINDHSTRANLANSLIKSNEVDFLEYFYLRSDVENDIIMSLKSTHAPDAESFFCTLIAQLFKDNRSSLQRFRIFMKICSSFTDTGLDVFELLEQKPLEEVLPIIREWYTSEDMIKEVPRMKTELDLSLLRYFNE